MKKRILSIMLALCMVIMMLPQAVFAETYEDYEYSVSDGKATITSYNGSDEEVTIPDTLGGYPVTAIGMSAFHNKTGIRKIVIPDSVTSIGKNAFYWCSSLESINIPDSVTSIGINAFGSCRNLIEITVDEDNEYYSSVNGVLLDKNKTRLLAFPGGYIGTFDIPDTVTDIENSAFYDCRKLEGVTIPTGVTVIGLQVFMSCYNLKSVTIPSSVKRIGEKAFKNCTSLEYINIPDSVISISDSAFHSCTSLKSIVIPHKVTAISDRTFTFCSSLENVFLSDKVTSIGVSAIPDTTSQIRYSLDETAGKVTITDVSLGSGRTTVEIPSYIDGYPVSAVKASAFDGCDSLERIYLPENISVPDGELPDTATKISYSLDTDKGEATITKIELADGKENVDIPEKIFGYPVAAVAKSEQSKVGAHTCKGGTATCTKKAECAICGKEYGELSDHTFTAETINEDTVKTAGTCTTEAVYYYSCSVCGEVESDDNHTFTGEKDPDNHTGKLKWTQTETQHKQYYDCCDKITVAAEDHDWENGECSKCDYVCTHAGGTPTCTKKAVCEVCGEEYGNLDPDNHTGEQVWVQTATQHEKKWNCCDEITVAAEDHSWENGVCAECDYVCEHSYKWQNEDGKYWKKCSVCGVETAKTDLPELTIDAPDKVCRTQDCEVSVLLPDNIVKADLSYKFNDFDGTLSSAIEDGKISGILFAREYPAAEYSFLVTITAETDDGYVLTERKLVTIQTEHSGGEATCTKKAVCEVCGKEYGDLDPDNHTGELTWTQTEKQHEQKWDCCGEITVSAEAHDWKNGVCAECDYVCEHSYEWQSDNSKYWKKCSVCGAETAKKDLPELTIDAPDKVCRTQDCEVSVLLPDNIIDAHLAFEFKGLGGGLKAEVKDGKISGVISADGYVSDENSFVVKIIVEMGDGYVLTESKTVEIQNEHSGGKATCTKKAVCEVCGEEYGELDSTNHDLEHVPAKAATTSETGNKEYWRCKNCGKYFSDKDGKNEITLKDVEISKLTPESKPQNTSSTSTAVKSDESPSTGGSVGTAIMLVSGVTILAAWACGKRKKAQTK